MHDSSYPLESVLLSQASSLRSLAWSLLGDEHAADDVLQETWLQAAGNAQAVEARSGSVDGWLRRVVSNLALNRQRAGRSRSFHEASAAQSETLGATDELVAQREVMLKVIDAISELEDPYQSVIVMRFYQDLAPRFIAKERGVPVATIKSQLNRGLEKLRARLDEESGGERKAWAGVLAASFGEAEVATAGVGVATGLVALAASVLIATGVWMFTSGGEPAAASASNSSAMLGSLPNEEASFASGGLAAQDQDAPRENDRLERVALESETPWSAGAAIPPYHFTLDLEVVGSSDLPAKNMGVLMAPPDHPMNRVGSTDSLGKLRVRWHGHESRMTVVVGLEHSGGLETALREIEVSSDSTEKIRLTSGHNDILETQELAEMGADMSAPGAAIEYVTDGAPLQRPRLPDSILETVRDERTAEVGFIWRDSREEREIYDFDLRVDAESFVLGSLRYAGTASDKQPKAIRRPSTAKKLLIVGQVQCGSGQPAEGAFVAGFISSGGSAGTIVKDGRFQMALKASETLDLRAGGGQFGVASQTLQFELEDLPERFEWNPFLERGNEIVGRLSLAEETEAEDWLIESEIETGSGLHVDVSGMLEGQFSLLNLPGGKARLLLSNRDSWPLATTIRESWSPSPVETVIDFEEGDFLKAEAIKVLVVDEDGEPCDAEIQLWQRSSGRGIWIGYDEEHESYRKGEVPFGTYQLRVGDADRGFHYEQTIEVAEEAIIEVGPIKLERASELRITVNGKPSVLDSEWMWRMRRRVAGVDSIVAIDPASDEGLISLPAGQYELTLSSPKFAMPPIVFTLAPGEKRSIDIALDEMGELILRAEPREDSSKDELQSFRILSAEDESEVHRGVVRDADPAHFALPAGDYLLEFSGERESFSILAGERTER